MTHFKDFLEGNESARFIFNPSWLEHILNLFFQGYPGEVWEELMDTKINHCDFLEKIAYSLIAQEFDSKNLSSL